MTEMRDCYFCRNLAPPNAPPPPLTPKYLTILMTERRGAIVFCRILAPPNDPPPPPDATILNYLTQTERGRALPLVGFWRPPMPPPPPTPQYLTILMTERGRHYLMQDFAPPSPDATILNDHNDSERGWGRQYPVRS